MSFGVLETPKFITRRHRRMRHMSPQLHLVAPWIAHAHAADLAAMSAVLDEQPVHAALIQQTSRRGA